jgi:hypothetical protein
LQSRFSPSYLGFHVITFVFLLYSVLVHRNLHIALLACQSILITSRKSHCFTSLTMQDQPDPCLSQHHLARVTIESIRGLTDFFCTPPTLLPHRSASPLLDPFLSDHPFRNVNLFKSGSIGLGNRFSLIVLFYSILLVRLYHGGQR